MRALVAMSGGVDSAAAAILLQDQGLAVEGVTLELTGPSEARAAAAVCAALGMPHHVLDLRPAFEARVVEPFCRGWLAGRTPNPCVLCNRAIKFGALMDWALEAEADLFATGHYARIEAEGDRYNLKKALDPQKDQSYVLYTLPGARLARIRLPLGGLSKAEARAVVAGRGLSMEGRPESQDICFVPDGDHAGFIEGRCGPPPPPGDFVLADGTPLGRHRGLLHYTVGQRKGLGLSWPHPLYVLEKQPEQNRVVVGSLEQTLRDTLQVGDVHWVHGRPPGPVLASVRTRYHQREAPATVIPMSRDEDESDDAADCAAAARGAAVAWGAATAWVVFDEPVPGPAPGQAAVFYDGDTVLGGGTIL